MSLGYIYITICPNKKVYIGQHQTSKYDKNYYGSGKVLKNIIKKYGKDKLVNKVLEWCDSLEDLNNKEKWWIRYFRKSNMICINIDDGGKGAEAHTRFKLRKSHKIISQTDEHKSKFREYCMSKYPSHQIDDKYYEKNPVRRQDFLRRCRNKGLNFDDYIEAHVATKSFGKHIKLYKYYHKDKTCPIVHRDYESEELLKQYAMNPTPRSTFKTSCKHRGWNFDDFDEIFAGWYYFPNNDNHRAKRYFYIKRIED